MSIYLAAADAVEREAVRAASLAAVAEDLRKVGSLQQAANDAQNRLTQIEAAIAEAQAKLDELHDTTGAVEQATADKLIAAKREAEIIVDDAKAEAARSGKAAVTAFESAKIEAERIVAQARNDGDSIIRSANAAAAALKPEIEAGLAIFASIEAQSSAKQAQLDEINAALAKLKTKF